MADGVAGGPTGRAGGVHAAKVAGEADRGQRAVRRRGARESMTPGTGNSRAELLVLVAEPAHVVRLPLDRIPALRAAIRALHRDLAAAEEALDARWHADDS